MTAPSHTTAYIVVGALFVASWLMFANFGFAYVASSTSYRLQSDSINIGGGLSTSTNYAMEDTLGEMGTGTSTSASYKLKAGYQQMHESVLTLSAPSDITMTPLTITQDTAVGNATWTVITDNAAGYTLDVKASASPALVDSGTSEVFADYTEATPGVKELWSVSNAYEFGFSGLGNDTTGYDNGTPDADCVDTANVPSATLIWEGFNGTTNIEIASSSSPTISGTNSTLCVATEQETVFAPSGSYTATLTVTAVAQ